MSGGVIVADMHFPDRLNQSRSDLGVRLFNATGSDVKRLIYNLRLPEATEDQFEIVDTERSKNAATCGVM